jgi:hypothetical protein
LIFSISPSPVNITPLKILERAFVSSTLNPTRAAKS